MSERDPTHTPAAADDEPFLGRWSRLKAQARERDAPPPAPTDAQAPDSLPAATAEPAPAGEAPPPVQLPDIDQLGQDSDYSAFLTPGVDAELRKRALRKLFHSPKFNVFDGLDTYRDDFTSFPALGSIVTADMRHQIEQAARELAARAEKALARDTPATEAAPPAVTHKPPPAPAAESTARNEEDAEHGPA
jgi:hypothetical protein